jgi:hypothetical protein
VRLLLPGEVADRIVSSKRIIQRIIHRGKSPLLSGRASGLLSNSNGCDSRSIAQGELPLTRIRHTYWRVLHGIRGVIVVIKLDAMQQQRLSTYIVIAIGFIIVLLALRCRIR